MMTSKKKQLLVLIALVLGTIALSVNQKGAQQLAKIVGKSDYSSEKNALVQEFASAYEPEASPSGVVREFALTASESQVEIVQGYETNVWSYNGTVPGPQLRVKLGETVRVAFENDLPEETTVHWHGVRVANEMDGVPGVTQDPIQPGASFVYEFTPKDAGTFWFHPHVRGSEQVERGLYGVLIVEDEQEHSYSQDVVWVVDDWRLLSDSQVSPNFNTMHDLMHDGRWGNVITVNGKQQEQLEVNAGERIRLRMINTSNGRIYAPSFGQLDAKIIAVDGMYVRKPLDASGYELAPGNRIDVDIKVDPSLAGKQIDIQDFFTQNTNKLGAITVSDTVVATPSFEYPTNKSVPNWVSAVDLPVDHDITMNARRLGGMGIEWTLGGKAFPNTDQLSLKAGNFYKISYTNESFRLHPMHLHGQFFKVISRNGVPVDEPYFQDTVLVHSKETVEIGIIPLDTGAWAHHCHILEHAEAGMMQVVNVI